jgi:hypothetical protein
VRAIPQVVSDVPDTGETEPRAHFIDDYFQIERQIFKGLFRNSDDFCQVLLRTLHQHAVTFTTKPRDLKKFQASQNVTDDQVAFQETLGYLLGLVRVWSTGDNLNLSFGKMLPYPSTNS